ncbi:MAG TPA: hypothetical protein VKU77_38620 [Streptosporangiaceae bacterium]|jgi:hypothetical protein|nr:hypothetical protein [Streptosporangiaceae bacterium]
MTDLERRLRAAMESSVAAEHPPADLVARVRRRHRWHLARLGAIGVTAVIAAAVAVSPARSALLKSVTTRPATSAVLPRGQVYGCDAQTYGALQSDWRRFAIQAGPVWIINRGIAPDFNFRNPDGTLNAVPLIVLVRDNVTVSVEPAGPGQRFIRFLPTVGPDVYTMSDGLPTATFIGCSAQTALFGDGLTEYYIGVVVAGPRCVTIDVRTSAGQAPYRATLQFGTCGS